MELHALQLLIAEHQVIRKGLEILESMAAQLRGGSQLPIEDVEALLAMFQTFADRCHHMKEEWGLFPHMEGKGIPCMGGPLGVMLCEHLRGRVLRHQMKGALPYVAADPQAKAQFISAATEYVQLMMEHIAREENVLFQMAQQVTNPKEDERLVEAFHSVEEEVVGREVHHRMEQLVEELASRYGA